MGSLVHLLRFLYRLSQASPGGRGRIAFAVAASILAGAASTGFVLLINAAFQAEAERSRLLVWFVVLCVALPGFRFVSNWLLLGLAERGQLQLRLDLARRLLGQPLRRIEQLGAAKVLAVLTDDVGAIIAALTQLPLILMHLTVVVGCLIYMGWLSWPLLLVTLAFLAVGVVTYLFPLQHANDLFERTRQVWDRQFRQFRGLTEGFKELKLHQGRRRDFVEGEMAQAGRERMAFRMRAIVVHSLAASWSQVLFFVVIGLLLFGVPAWLPVEREVLIGYTLAILYLLTPLDVILTLSTVLNAGLVAVRRVEELGLSMGGGIADVGEEEASGPPPTFERLGLAGVKHVYRRENRDESFTLGPIDLEIRAGECVFLVGGNGSGKTTLAKILLGLYRPEEGELRLDGRAVAPEELPAYRQLFACVFSDFFLFDRLLGVSTQGAEARLQRYLERLHLERKVRVDEGNFSTLELSQGQRKRLALLVAYLEDRPVYLFDEWAADQDPSFKDVFYRELLPELRARGKTVIAITHDDRYFSFADRVLKLEDGRLVGADG